MMRLAGTLLRIPLAVLGEVVDRLLGPDELRDCTWPATTPPGEDALELDGRIFHREDIENCVVDLPEEYNGFQLVVDDSIPAIFGPVIIKSGTGWDD